MTAPSSRFGTVPAILEWINQLGGPLANGGIGGPSANGGIGGPSTNGDIGGPSTNGGIGGPSANGGIGGPSANSDIGELSANGGNGGPSANGGIGGPSANGVHGRDRRGRFAKGNSGGPGNPFARRVAALRSALCRAITDEDIQEVARDLLDRAKRGNLAAAKLLWLYTIGKPGDAVDPDSLDLHEWSIFRQSPADGNQLQAVLGSMPIRLACEMLRATLPVLQQERAGQLVEQMDRREARGAKRAAATVTEALSRS